MLPLLKDNVDPANHDEEDLNQLEVLFAILDNETERLSIDNYTFECTSLEQIFLDMERDVAGPQSQKLLEKIGMKKEDAVPLKDLGLVFLSNLRDFLHSDLSP